MNGAPRWCGGSGFVSYLVQLFCRWRWDTYLLRCGELVGLLPCVTEGFESVCALLPELNLEVVADEDVVEPVGAVLGEPDLFVEVLEGGVAVAKVLAASVVDGPDKTPHCFLLFFVGLYRAGLRVGGDHLVGELELHRCEIDAASTELHRGDGVEVEEMCVLCTGLGQKCERSFCVDTSVMEHWPKFSGLRLSGSAPGVEPED